MGKTIYLECNSGISGDMTVAALLDLGASEKVLRQVLDSIPAGGFQIEIGRVNKAGIDCCDFRVILDEAHENHDHDMEYLHGHEHDPAHENASAHAYAHDMEHNHDHVHDHVHGHDHDHPHTHSHPHHEHRGMAEIRAILAGTQMTERARQTASRIFTILAEAESKAHNVPVEEVHFHEVGAIDSIVDIVAAAVCLDDLDVTEVIVPRLCEGRGTVRCQHGILPIPVPATANIMTSYRLPVEFTNVQGELVTPTGAAIVAAVRTRDKLPETVRICGIGLGAGKRSYERPSILRAMWLDTAQEERDRIWKLESNIDDCSGEALGFVMDRLFSAGARDVFFLPAYMKKNRPAWVLSVLCGEEDVERMERIIFRETTTIGIRRTAMERTVLKRELIDVQTPYGEARVKVCRLGEETRFYPEYESVARICKEQGLPYGEVYRMILEKC